MFFNRNYSPLIKFIKGLFFNQEVINNKMENEDKEFLTKVYDILGNFEIEIIALELDYSEEKEAEFIKKIYDIFNDEIKGDFLKIIKKLENGDNDRRKENNGSYFG